MDFKKIHMGSLIKQKMIEKGIEISSICTIIGCTEEEVHEVFTSKSLDTEKMLLLSQYLEYDFFRIYTHHLILFAPKQKDDGGSISVKNKMKSPQFVKSIYTKEVIDFVLEQIECGDMSKHQIIEEYHIPKTTLYRWIEKYKK